MVSEMVKLQMPVPAAPEPHPSRPVVYQVNVPEQHRGAYIQMQINDVSVKVMLPTWCVRLEAIQVDAHDHLAVVAIDNAGSRKLIGQVPYSTIGIPPKGGAPA